MGSQLIGDDFFAFEILHRANLGSDDKLVFRPIVRRLSQVDEVFAIFGVAHV